MKQQHPSTRRNFLKRTLTGLTLSMAFGTGLVLNSAVNAEVGEPEKEDLKFGFIKLTDMAPLAVAYEKGYFEDEGLYVTLEAQANWKVLLDRVIDGELDGAHMLAGQPLGATIGFGTQAHVITAFSMDLNGNGITVSNGSLISHGNIFSKTLESGQTHISIGSVTAAAISGNTFENSAAKIISMNTDTNLVVIDTTGEYEVYRHDYQSHTIDKYFMPAKVDVSSLFNVLDFGAVADMETENTAAFKAAIQTAEQNGGGTVPGQPLGKDRCECANGPGFSKGAPGFCLIFLFHDIVF